MRVIVTLAAAAAVGWVFERLAVPGGTIVGAMVGAAAVSLALGGAQIVVPRPLVWSGYVVIGAVIGSSVTRDFVSDLRAIAVPALVAGVAIIVAGLAIAVALRWTGIAPSGIVLATSPGAISAVTAIAAEDGTGPQVAVFHTVRIVLVLLSLPVLQRLSGG